MDELDGDLKEAFDALPDRDALLGALTEWLAADEPLDRALGAAQITELVDRVHDAMGIVEPDEDHEHAFVNATAGLRMALVTYRRQGMGPKNALARIAFTIAARR